MLDGKDGNLFWVLINDKCYKPRRLWWIGITTIFEKLHTACHLIQIWEISS